MASPPCLRLCVLGLLLVLCGFPHRAAAEVTPLAVRDGHCEAVLPTVTEDTFYLVLGSLSPHAGPHRVTIRTEATAAPVALPRPPAVRDERWAELVDDLAQRQARARSQHPVAQQAPPIEPPRRKVFHLFTGDQDFQNTRQYAAVHAELCAVGKHCQVYVDRDHKDRDGLQATVKDTIRTFDEGVYPKAREWLGRCLDVDGDGRFTILFTSLLSRLQGGKVSLGGCVRGSDFDRELTAPFSNRCDMMYLNTDLKPGPHLRTLITHEYTHAVVFSEHVFGEYLPMAARHDEESWLNEALAHVVEDRHGHSWSNLDYRVSAFLNAPERYALVVPDYYGSGLWRTPGTRGSAYLFLRWCVDRCGDDLPARLVQSNLQGVLNLETAAQRPFAALFREWSVALLGGGGLALDGIMPLRRPDLRRPLASRLLCGPRFDEVPLDRGRHEVQLAGTSVAYLLLHSPAGPRSRVTVAATPDSDLQVTLVRRPAGARLGLRCVREPDGKGVRLIVTAHGAGVKLDDVAWERLLPRGEPADTSYRPNAPAGQAVRSWFGKPRLPAGESRHSQVIDLPHGREALIFKIAATDDAGNRVAAWAILSGE